MSLFTIPVYKQSKYSNCWNYDRYIDSDQPGFGFDVIDQDGIKRLLFIDDASAAGIVRSYILQQHGDTVGLCEDLKNPNDDESKDWYHYFCNYNHDKNQLTVMSLDYAVKNPIIDLSYQIKFFISEFAYQHVRYAKILYNNSVVDCMK